MSIHDFFSERRCQNEKFQPSTCFIAKRNGHCFSIMQASCKIKYKYKPLNISDDKWIKFMDLVHVSAGQ